MTLSIPAYPKVAEELLARVELPEGELDYEALDELARVLPDSVNLRPKSYRHWAAAALLTEALELRWGENAHGYAGGNIPIYYTLPQMRGREWCCPDFILVPGAQPQERRTKWVVWCENGVRPVILIDFTSNSHPLSGEHNLGLYARLLGSGEYYLYDLDAGSLRGWSYSRYEAHGEILPEHQGWLWSYFVPWKLGAWKGEWKGMSGTWLRWHDEAGRLMPTRSEASHR